MTNNINNKKVVEEVAGALLNREKVVFLFGAGASIPSGMPSTGKLKNSLFEEKISPVLDGLKHQHFFSP